MAEEKRRKAVLRSPNYPAFGLSEAIVRAKTVFDHEKRNYTPPDVLAQDLGYKPKTGPANRALSALRQYGLLEEKGGAYRLSNLANTILFSPEDSQERTTALAESARKPAIFKEILQAYPDGLPSDTALRSWLITRKSFNPASVDEFIKSLKATIGLAKLAPSSYDEGEHETMEGLGMPPETEERGGDEAKARTGTGPAVQVFNWALSMPRNIRAELRLYGRDLRKEDIERLRKQLDLIEEAFEDAQEEPSDG